MSECDGEVRGRAELQIRGSAHHVVVRARRDAAASYRSRESIFDARFEGVEPHVRVEGGRVDVDYGWSSFWDWLSGGYRSAELELASGVSWAMRVRGGMHALHADLRGLDVEGVAIDGGASEVELLLGRPVGTARVVVRGGAERFLVTRPDAVAMSVTVRGGASDIRFDTLELGAVGGRTHWESPSFAGARDRFVVEIVGGISHASFTGDRAFQGAGDDGVRAAI